MAEPSLLLPPELQLRARERLLTTDGTLLDLEKAEAAPEQGAEEPPPKGRRRPGRSFTSLVPPPSWSSLRMRTLTKPCGASAVARACRCSTPLARSWLSQVVSDRGRDARSLLGDVLV
mmetsp:Transcript_31529/g.94834  ORF Transcript_31529/g.94834 Transcript_31529/m.94834 type:complete len:118 (+) Transcript_31529:250-603(+)